MAQNIGTLVTAAIRPNDSLDLIASAFSNEIKGGVHSVTSSTDRNAIFSVRRDWGMLCYVVNDNKTYQLSYGYTSNNINDNGNWIEFSGSGSSNGEWINSVISVSTSEPGSPSDGDRYLVGLSASAVITGTNWSAHGSGGFVAQYNSALSIWNYTTPTNGMSVRVDNEENAIYRYRGTYSTGEWQKEKESQVRYISANLISGASYSATSSPYLSDYEQETVYIVKFDTTNVGASASLSINGLPHKTIKKNSGQSLIDLVSNDISVIKQYFLSYNGSFFELLDTSGGGNGLSNQYYISPTENITVPISNQYWIYGDLTIDGILDNYGQVVVANGNINIPNAGQLNDYGTVSLITFAEIDGLGQTNYLPKWKGSYMLTATSSIYDDSYRVSIDSQTFSVSGDLVFTKGATSGYVLTSDSSGFATWQEPSVNKYSATQSFVGGITYSISHNLNSKSIIVNFWDENLGDLVVPSVKKTSLNALDVRFSSTLSNVRIVILS